MELAEEMLEFLQDIPKDLGLDWTKNLDFLYYFEAARMRLIRDALAKQGYAKDSRLNVLDVGYLHGLLPEFIQRNYLNVRFTVIDHPQSPIFNNPGYLKLIAGRNYLKLVPLDLKQVDSLTETYDLIVLGEVVEHLDPTEVTKTLQELRKKINPGGLLLITTPNAIGIFNAVMAFFEKDSIIVAPIPDPMMGYAHIHLWSPRLLEQTANYCSFKRVYLEFYNGREDEKFAYDAKHFSSWKHFIWLKFAEWISNRFPSRRGFFVASFKPV